MQNDTTFASTGQHRVIYSPHRLRETAGLATQQEVFVQSVGVGTVRAAGEDMVSPEAETGADTKEGGVPAARS